MKSDLPKPSAKDDAKAAEEAVAEWKLLKKQIKEAATIQSARLENAMCTGRRWTPSDFETLIVKQPLMTLLARKLVWGGVDAKGKKLSTFRITDERDFADVKDSPVDVHKAASVGIVHPLELSESEKKEWGGVMGDYEIVPPFAQLGREVYSLEKKEESQNELTRYQGLEFVAPTLVFGLEKMGWQRGLGVDNGCFDEHSKYFQAADLTAVVRYEGAGMGMITPDYTITLEQVAFCPGRRKPSGFDHKLEGKIELGKVSAIVISEVLADMQVLKRKAK